MAYEITANRKRPIFFDDLEGQDFVVATLKNMLQTGSIAHAYLFAGPRGVGKTSAARILARALNAPEGPTANPPIDYPGSEEISRGMSMDVIEIDGASNTSVNDVRQIKDEVLFPPNSSRYKIYIIDEVHMLSNSAFNALLKTIEEPPPYIIFIFATTEVHKVPATIRSRCQQFNFRLISLDVIRTMLEKLVEELGITAEREALLWIAKEARGSLRDAYTLFDQVLAFSDNNIHLELIRDKLGLVGHEVMNEMAELMAEGDVDRVLELCDQSISGGSSVEQIIIDLSEYFRNILFIKSGIKKEALLGINPERFSAKVLETFSREQIERALDLLLDSYRNIRYSLNQRYELELVLSRLASLNGYLSPKEILKEVKKLRELVYSTPIPQTTEPGNGTSGDQGIEIPGGEPGREETISKSVSLNEEQRNEVISLIRKAKPALGSVLEKALEWNRNGEALEILFENSFSANSAEQERELLSKTLSDVLNENLEISINIKKNEEQTAEELDSSVELVKKVFRGEVIQED